MAKGRTVQKVRSAFPVISLLRPSSYAWRTAFERNGGILTVSVFRRRGFPRVPPDFFPLSIPSNLVCRDSVRRSLRRPYRFQKIIFACFTTHYPNKPPERHNFMRQELAFRRNLLKMRPRFGRKTKCDVSKVAPVAQLDRVPGYEPGGRGFESYPAHQDNPRSPKAVWDFLFSASHFFRQVRSCVRFLPNSPLFLRLTPPHGLSSFSPAPPFPFGPHWFLFSNSVRALMKPR